MPDPISFIDTSRHNKLIEISWNLIETSSKYSVDVVSGATILQNLDLGNRNGFSYVHDSTAGVIFRVMALDSDNVIIASSNKPISFSNFTLVRANAIVYTSGTYIYASGSETTTGFVVRYRKNDVPLNFYFTGNYSFLPEEINSNATIFGFSSGTENYSLPSSFTFEDLRPHKQIVFKEKTSQEKYYLGCTPPNFVSGSLATGFVTFEFTTSYGFPVETIDIRRSKEYSGKPIVIFRKDLDLNTTGKLGITFDNTFSFTYLPNISGFKYQGVVLGSRYYTNILERSIDR